MVTQTDPVAEVTAMWGEQQATGGLTEIVATTWFVAGSMREMLGPPLAEGPAVCDPDRSRRGGNPVRYLKH